MVHTLQNLKGYTIDKRLKEFRKLKFNRKSGPSIEFIPFKSLKGRELLKMLNAEIRNSK